MTTKKNQTIKVGVMPIGIGLTLIIGAILAYNLFKGDKRFFLAGDTSHGHYQIELECNSCHSDAFSGGDKMQQACESCHAKELDKVSDSHPKKVFTDPRNAELLALLDARYCVTCHREHKPEITREFGVTLAADFCFHCHQDIAKERPSHKEFEFQTCATSGCHNFHDNSMLYEKFMAKHLDEPAIKENPIVPQKTALQRWLKKHKKKLPLEVAKPDLENFTELAIQNIDQDLAQIVGQWKRSVHAKTEANCSSCHQTDQSSGKVASFKVLAIDSSCKDCHQRQHSAFLESKHGMRLAHALSPMSTDKARLKVQSDSARQLNCHSCHNPHSLNVADASMDACLGCHQDEHTLNYKSSKHFTLWQNELAGRGDIGSGVNCATCHLPKIKKGKRVTVVHNQNLNLRPNTKMLRSVCMNCHGMEFSLAALADKKLINSNFQGVPQAQHQTIELIKERLKLRQSNQNQQEN